MPLPEPEGGHHVTSYEVSLEREIDRLEKAVGALEREMASLNDRLVRYQDEITRLNTLLYSALE